MWGLLKNVHKQIWWHGVWSGEAIQFIFSTIFQLHLPTHSTLLICDFTVFRVYSWWCHFFVQLLFKTELILMKLNYGAWWKEFNKLAVNVLIRDWSSIFTCGGGGVMCLRWCRKGFQLFEGHIRHLLRCVSRSNSFVAENCCQTYYHSMEGKGGGSADKCIWTSKMWWRKMLNKKEV